MPRRATGVIDVAQLTCHERKPGVSLRRLLTMRVRFTWLAAATVLLGGAHCTQEGSDTAAAIPASTPPPAAFDLPMKDTSPEELAPDGYKHALVLRIRRDFGKRDFEIAMDAWMPDEAPKQIDAVRLWWFKAHKDGERGAFSKKTSRNFEVSYQRKDDESWSVVFALSDGRHFTFRVRSTGGHAAAAFAEVMQSDGTKIDACRVTDAELRAKTTLGITTGIKDLSVTCVDSSGVEHQGILAS